MVHRSCFHIVSPHPAPTPTKGRISLSRERARKHQYFQQIKSYAVQYFFLLRPSPLSNPPTLPRSPLSVGEVEHSLVKLPPLVSNQRIYIYIQYIFLFSFFFFSRVDRYTER